MLAANRQQELESIQLLSNEIAVALDGDDLPTALELEIERGERVRAALGPPLTDEERVRLMGLIQAVVDADERIRAALDAARLRLGRDSGNGAVRLRAARAYQGQ